jgi:hypothetical protein
VHDGGLDVAGRLFSVKSDSLTPTGAGRDLTSSITLNAFTFGSSTTTTPAVPAPAPTDTSSTTTGTTTTSGG